MKMPSGRRANSRLRSVFAHAEGQGAQVVAVEGEEIKA
jgi:hypothetical protein